MVVDLLADGLNLFVADLDKIFVKSIALHEEHAHAHFIRCLFLDLVDCILVLLNLSLKFLLFEWCLLQEIGDSLFFRKQEQEFIVDVKALAYSTEVFRNDAFNLLCCLGNDQVIVFDLPEFGLVIVSNLNIGSGHAFGDGDHVKHDGYQLLTHVIKVVGKVNFVLSENEGQSDEGVLELSVGVILTDDDVFRSGVLSVRLFELAEEVYVVRN